MTRTGWLISSGSSYMHTNIKFNTYNYKYVLNHWRPSVTMASVI